jgi:hypothetical protein
LAQTPGDPADGRSLTLKSFSYGALPEPSSIVEASAQMIGVGRGAKNQKLKAGTLSYLPDRSSSVGRPKYILIAKNIKVLFYIHSN